MTRTLNRFDPSLRATVLIATIAVCILAACGSAAPSSATTAAAYPTGTSTHAMKWGGVQRTFFVHRPPSTPPGRTLPLVLVLHGGFGSGAQAEQSYGWDAEADRSLFVVAYPDGLHRAWNAGGDCCGQAAADHIDDVGFLTSMVSRIEKAVPIDPTRVFATGISNGGIMAYRLACTTKMFAAIGPDSATMLGACPHPAPVSVVHIHGTADSRIPYYGGTGTGVAHINSPAVPNVTAFWRTVDRCAHPAASTSGVVTTSMATCPNGRSVELITIAGAGHQWPRSADHPLRQLILGTDAPSNALDATAVIWAFFAAHPAPSDPPPAFG